MKNSFLIGCIAAITFLTQACEPKYDGYTIKGKVSGFEEGSMIYLHQGGVKSKTIDSSLISNGKFSFTGKVDYPQKYYINNQRTKGTKYVVTSLYIDNTSIKIEGDFKDFTNCKITGGESQQVINELNTKTGDLQKKRNAIVDDAYSGKHSREEVDKLSVEAKKLYQQILKIEQEWARKNINTYPVINRIASQPEQFPLFNKEEIKELYNQLSDELKNSPDGQLIYNKYLVEHVQVGGPLYDFEAIQSDGIAFQFSEFAKGKHTLLIFTGVSCKWCRVLEKDLSSRYDKVKDNLNVVSFYVEGDKEYWLNYVTKKPKTWTVVSDLKRFKSNVVIHYDVHAVPQAVLIDNKGKVIKISDGYEEDFMNEVEEIVTK